MLLKMAKKSHNQHNKNNKSKPGFKEKVDALLLGYLCLCLFVLAFTLMKLGNENILTGDLYHNISAATLILTGLVMVAISGGGMDYVFAVFNKRK